MSHEDPRGVRLSVPRKQKGAGDSREEWMRPEEIEAKSFEIISRELADRHWAPDEEAVVKRVIHTTADFDYAENLQFSSGAAEAGIRALRKGAVIVTDTQMVRAGINKRALEALGGRTVCFMSDPDVAEEAGARGITRAAVSMERAAALEGPLIFAIGNAPTALMRLEGLIREKSVAPELIIGVPVGFVNVVESKDRIRRTGVPWIVAAGRKGGSNVAAAVCNALLYRCGTLRPETAL